MSEYNLKKILDSILKQIGEHEEGREYTEELKELYDYMDELNSKKQIIIEYPEIEDVIQNYIVEWGIWGIAMMRTDLKPRFSLVSSAFCFQISNMLLGICKLVKDGLDYQAMCLIRVLLEMIMSFLAMLIDTNYREKYLETSDVSKEHSIWSSTLKMKKAEKIVWNYATSINEETSKYCDECKKIYEGMYSDLSKFEHNSYANMVVMQFTLKGNDRLELNLNGNKVLSTERVLKQVLMVMVPLEALFSRVIYEKDVNFPEDEYGQKMWSFGITLHIMVSDLAQQYLENMEKNTTLKDNE